MQKAASAIIIAVIAFVAIVFGIGALGAISGEAVEGTAYEGAFEMAEGLASGTIPVLFTGFILIVIGALVLAIRGMTKDSRGRRGGY